MDIWKKKTLEQMLHSAEKSDLKKNLTSKDLAALGIGAVVGTGIFVSTGVGAHLAGPAVVLSFIVAAVISALCALTYSELATMFPVAGSTYAYSYVAFGELIAWIIGWDLMLEYLVSSAAVASGWSGTFVGLLSSAGLNLPNAIIKTPSAGGIIDMPAVLITMFVTWILFIGIKESAKLNNKIVLIKVGVIILFVILGVFHINVANYKPFAPFGWSGVMAGASIIFFAYIGFDAVSTAAEETINPKRDVPRGLAICLGIVIILYIAVALVITGMVPYKEIIENNAVPGALARFGINWGAALVGTGAVIGMISTLLVMLYGQIRVFMVMSRDGLLPKVFSKVHPIHKTPTLCTIITGSIAGIMAGFLPLDEIIKLCNIGTLFAFILVSIGVIVLRKTMPNIERKFKCPWVPVLPIISALACIYLMSALPLVTWIRFIIWLLIGIVIYFVYSRHHSLLQKEK
ncbi:amino acid permease [Clostridium estertheticum]|uniref:Amino acid permease n=2 Tax=Clostridium estertheticum TaxID=238834 RepID=A0A1J0GDM2_9CLOT|nr:amino acid permease [Clostridium estertheticum]APC39458.1 amino acid permease [Clostridium estertheticum subsp. estertheticum]MBU3184713.1 amino acid permease [Clostridium estertheticum]MBX4260165.1 amino acid permease [Clostridium estertheticum]MBZ9614520.1 amino acid permease [Clostridium estertheticum subsp. laramiense]MPQ30756.1 amino acid permease [Clostridium estertheticum]